MRIIDMHVHTTKSDGTYTPSGVVRLAHKAGVSAVAITDHDSTDGIDEAVRAGNACGTEVVPGIEISVGETGGVHILGYYIDKNNETLKKTVGVLQNGRAERNNDMIDMLRRLGYNVSYDDVRAYAGTENIGRLHIAGYIKSTGQTRNSRVFFKKYLADDGAAYVHRKTVTETEGIEAIRAAGGLPFLAHISYLKASHSETEETVKRMISCGLAGIEVYYSNYTAEDESFCLYLCEKYKLLKSGGTDFHGARRKGVYLGVGKGNMCVPYELLTEIKKAVATARL